MRRAGFGWRSGEFFTGRPGPSMLWPTRCVSTFPCGRQLHSCEIFIPPLTRQRLVEKIHVFLPMCPPLRLVTAERPALCYITFSTRIFVLFSIVFCLWCPTFILFLALLSVLLLYCVTLSCPFHIASTLVLFCLSRTGEPCRMRV